MHMRKINRIAIVGAGDMGSQVAAELRRNGLDVTTCPDGRSNRSRKLSTQAGMRAVDNLETLVADAADAKRRSLGEVTEIYHRTLLDHLGRV